MPFNSKTYHLNKARRDRDLHMANARLDREAARTEPDERWRDHYFARMRNRVTMARWANTQLRFALRHRAIDENRYDDATGRYVK